MILFIALGLWSAGWVMLFRVPRCLPGEPARHAPQLSIIIPARNEERNLPRLLDSLRRQVPPPDEILVVDDDSTDGSVAIAREAGVRVVASKPLPEGWRGKNWACHQGAAVARGEVLLFVDADTWFEPGGLQRVLGMWMRQGGVLSVGAYHAVAFAYEELSAYFNLMMNIGIGAFTAWGAQRQPAGLFGPFLMLDRKTYAQSGGHEAVKSRILENYFMAAGFRRLGIAMQCCGGKGSFHMRMYPHGLRDLVAGWSKALMEGAAQSPPMLLLLAVAWIGGSILAAAGLLQTLVGVSPRPALAAGVYLLYAAQLTWMLRSIGSFRFWTGCCYPIPLLFYLALFARAALLARRGRAVAWKGRTIISDSARKRAPHDR